MPSAGDKIHAAGYRFVTTVIKTATGTFDKADYPGLIAVEVECVGSGAGSGGVAATTGAQGAASGGGGGGGYAKLFILAADLLTSETVTVGAAGAAGSSGNNAGGNGNTSSFGAHVSASGGSGGSGGAASAVTLSTAGGTGGTGTSGDINLDGESGGWGVVIVDGAPGIQIIRTAHGGQSMLSVNARVPAGNTSGNAGKSYGGGAAGAVNSVSQSARAGSAGAAGVVLIHVYT